MTFAELWEILRDRLGLGLNTPAPRLTAAEQRAIRRRFRLRFHHFKLLLAADKEVLAAVSELEEALAGTRFAGPGQVRAQCIRAYTGCVRMVRHLEGLTGRERPVLAAQVAGIMNRLAMVFSAQERDLPGPLVLPMRDVTLAAAGEVGNKMANLGELAARLSLRTPDGFAITASAFRAFFERGGLGAEIARLLGGVERGDLDGLLRVSSAIRQRILDAPLPPELIGALDAARADLAARGGGPLRLAVRSSALCEDTPDASFAGQFLTRLNVPEEGLAAAYKEVLASKYDLTALAYRLGKGIPDTDVVMCVGCLRMADAVAGGVVYTVDPLGAARDEVVIHAVLGLPKAVVDGVSDADLYRVGRGRGRIRELRIGTKTARCVLSPAGGVAETPVAPAEAARPSLTEDQARELARLAVVVERHFDTPQDIEFSLDADGGFTMLQARPLRRLALRSPENRARLAQGAECLARGGVTASPGAAAGPAVVVRKYADTLTFPHGGVLVAEQPQARWATLLDRVGAVVTEQGTAAGHLANVAREFGVPALFGLAGAVERLAGGAAGPQTVTVDADGLAVYRGRVEPLLKEERAGRDPARMPDRRLVERAAALVVPLTLLDAASPRFDPEHCGTLHDVTRYCHESAVQELARPGAQPLPELAARRLRYRGGRTQYWVVNLDDGLDEGTGGGARRPAGRDVDFGQVVSRPMLALWRGMTFRPWQGPPGVDGKGFMAVMFEATTNPELDPAVKADMGRRNVFMVSRNYCCLQSHYGFHFCGVEAMLGDPELANYATLHFKGGAADEARRVLRARLVADMLEDRGFEAEVRQDSVLARATGYGDTGTAQRLAVLGYLLLHTRQLDMVMRRGAVVDALRQRMEDDLDRLTQADAD
ncbi:MAG: PEP/pyruvate-binding domain-containing protein [Desulfovibrionaceae bacterium]